MKQHARKVKKARKMRTPLEIKLGVGIFDSKQWLERKSAKQQEVIKEYMSALGKKGGNTTLERHGLDHYKERAKHMNEVIKQKKESLIN